MQDLIIIALALVAAAFIGWRVVKGFTSQECNGCSSCSAKKEKSLL